MKQVKYRVLYKWFTGNGGVHEEDLATYREAVDSRDRCINLMGAIQSCWIEKNVTRAMPVGVVLKRKEPSGKVL